MKFFKNWEGAQIEEINNSFAIAECKPNQVVYKAGDVANVFYIVRAGSLYMESVVKIDDTVRYPVGPKQWEYKKTSRTYSYRVKEFKKGDMFGHEEIYDNYERQCTIISINESELMYINLDEFNNFFNNELAKEKLLQHFPRVDKKTIVQAIKGNDTVRK